MVYPAQILPRTTATGLQNTEDRHVAPLIDQRTHTGPTDHLFPVISNLGPCPLALGHHELVHGIAPFPDHLSFQRKTDLIYAQLHHGRAVLATRTRPCLRARAALHVRLLALEKASTHFNLAHIVIILPLKTDKYRTSDTST